MKQGQKIRFHGGWCSAKERCAVCNFSCGYIDSGVIIERYQIWDISSQKSILHPDDLWTARLETGSVVVGYTEQFEIVD